MKRKGLLAPLHRFCDFMRSEKVAKLAAQVIISLAIAMGIFSIAAVVLGLATSILQSLGCVGCRID